MHDGLALISGVPRDRLGLGPMKSPAPTEDRPYGRPSAPVGVCPVDQSEVLYINRNGADYAIAPHRINFRANLRALAEAGARRILGVHSVGGISPEAKPGTLVIPHDLVDYTHSRESTFAAAGAGKRAFVEFSNPFDPEMRNGLLTAAEGTGCLVRGVYGVTQGPRLETAAEIDRMERDGCTLVGMTLMPEAVLARELGIPYVSLSLVTNYAAGRNPEDEPGSIIEQHSAWLDTALERARKLLVRWLAVPESAARRGR